MYTFTDDEFEQVVADAIDSIPERFLDQLDNLSFMIEDEPAEDEDPDLLGVYDGIDMSERAEGYGFFEMPDTITIFKGPHERLEGSRADIVEEVRRTVVHEVGHYFGMDEDQIERMGYQ
ncbi:MAG: metallopeptidase family protein [Coriobacteriia bacterium]|nr:metallopeptidase family protein [Coriobacteriia bacterium]